MLCTNTRVSINPVFEWWLCAVTTELLGEAAGELLALLLLITTIAFCLIAKVVMKSQLGDQDMASFLGKWWPNPVH